MDKKEIILALIKDHLINTKLVDTLNDLGLSAEAYYLSLRTIILKLINYTDNEHIDDELTIKYNTLIATSKDLFDPEDEDRFKELALCIYKFLISINNN